MYIINPIIDINYYTYRKEIQEKQEEIRQLLNLTGTLSVDGNKSYLIDVEDCGSNKKTTNYCFEKVEKTIAHVKEKYGKDTFAIVTDNENKMTAMRTQVQRKYPKIITYGCASHYMNLVEGEVVNKQVLAQACHVNKYF